MPRFRKFPEIGERLQASASRSGSSAVVQVRDRQGVSGGTRRSARQQERVASGKSQNRFDGDDDFEYETPVRSGNYQQEQSQPQRISGFLQTPKSNAGRGKKSNTQVVVDSQASAINRLINTKKGSSGANAVKHRIPSSSLNFARPPPPVGARYQNIPKLTPKPTPKQQRQVASASNNPPPQPSTSPAFIVQKGKRQAKASTDPDWVQNQETIPLKVERNGGWVSNPNFSNNHSNGSEPKKRGRKRKIDGIQQSQNQGLTNFVKIEPSEMQKPQRKRGRQSAATANVKPRFPFCSICLSKENPSDYIINYMSSPNEYQRMKRAFQYIYKDLKLPFVPFNLETENVFDYCDLPLCDVCLVLYREIYDSFEVIERAKSQLKVKVEQMVSIIQASNRNPYTNQELSELKRSEEPLMVKYSNFRKRFETYESGDIRNESHTSGAGGTLPPTLARVRIITQVPTRSLSTQTFYTSAHFASNDAVVIVEPPKPNIVKLEPSEIPSTTTKTSNAPPIVVKKEPLKSNTVQKPTPTVAKPSIPSTSTVPGPKKAVSSTPTKTASTPVSGAKLHSSNNTTPNCTKPKENGEKDKSKPGGSLGLFKNMSMLSTAITKSTNSGTPSQIKSQPPEKKKPNFCSYLTIVKPNGGNGPTIIKRVAGPKPSTSQSSSGKIVDSSKPVDSDSSTEKSKLAQDSSASTSIKEEPREQPTESVDAESPESDPFLNTPSSSKGGNNGRKVDDTNQNDKQKEPEYLEPKLTCSTPNEDSSASDDELNVFRKHKKLIGVPVSPARARPSETKDDDDSNSDDELVSNEAVPALSES